MDQGLRDKLMAEFDEHLDEAQADGGLFDCYAEPLREMYSAALNEIMVQSNTCTQHTQAKMPRLAEVKSGVSAELRQSAHNNFFRVVEATYEFIARHISHA